MEFPIGQNTNLVGVKLPTYVITGASGAIGSALTQELVSKPSNIVVGVDVVESSVDHPQYFHLTGDVLNETFLIDLANKVEEFGNLKGIVNALVEPETKPYTSVKNLDFIRLQNSRQELILENWSYFSEEVFLAAFRTNVIGVHNTIRFLLKSILSSGEVSIINFASMYALKTPDQDLFANDLKFVYKPPAYSSSKAALLAYTEYLAEIFKGTGIRANCFSPGNIYSSQSDEFLRKYSQRTWSNRMMKLEEVIAPLVFLLSEESSYMNGHNLIVDGGWSRK